MATKYHYLQLRVRHVKCYKETAGWTADDMCIGGVAYYHDFRTKRFSGTLGDFDTGDSRDVQKKLVGMSMWGSNDKNYYHGVRPFYHNPGNSGITKCYGAVVMLGESDAGGFGQFIRYVLHPAVKKFAKQAKKAAIIAITAGADPKDLFKSSKSGALGVPNLAEFVLEGLDNVLQGLPDDVFNTIQVIPCGVTSYGKFGTGRSDTDNKSYYFYEKSGRKGAKYRLRMDWKKYT